MLAVLLCVIAPPLVLMAMDKYLDQVIPPADDFWGDANPDELFLLIGA